MSIEVLNAEATPLVKGEYYGWIRTNRSRGNRGVNVPADSFHKYGFVRCALPTHDWTFVKAVSATKFEVLPDFREVPDDGLYTPGVQAKFDNNTDVMQLCPEQLKAEKAYREQFLKSRDVQAETAVRVTEAKQKRNPESPSKTSAQTIEANANALAEAGPQMAQETSLDVALAATG